jgi:hypothetical protein
MGPHLTADEVERVVAAVRRGVVAVGDRAATAGAPR